MKTHAWIHAGWALAASAAFYAGFKTSAGGPDGRGGADAAHHDRPAEAGSGSARGPEARAQELRRSRGTSDGPGPIEKLFGCYSLEKVGLRALTKQAVTDPSPVTRRLAFARVLENMTAGNAMEIREQLVALDPDEQTWTEFNYAWGSLAGREAFEFARTSDEPDLNATFMGWAAADPQGALAMMSQLPAELEGQRAELERNLVAGIADNDLGFATQVAIQFSEGKDARQTNRLMRMVTTEALRSGGVENASLWAGALPDGQAKGAAMSHVSAAYVREDPAAAAAWAGAYADKDYAGAAIGEIGEEWAETDAKAAVAWLETLPEGSAQNRGFSEALGEWEDRDPQAAAQYLMAMERSPQRDAAIAGFARGYAWQDPQAAANWAMDIGDAQVRERALMQVGFAYHRRDPDNARVWLQQSGLSPEQQQRAMVGWR